MTSPTNPVTDALQRVLAAHHAAVYGYPVIGSDLADPAQIELARELEAAHRLSRDALREQLLARSADPVAADPGYAPASPVSDPATGQQWALALESTCAEAYRYLLTATAGPGLASTLATSLRSQALAGLTTAAQDGARWRLLLHPATPTVAFPGL